MKKSIAGGRRGRPLMSRMSRTVASGAMIAGLLAGCGGGGGSSDVAAGGGTGGTDGTGGTTTPPAASGGDASAIGAEQIATSSAFVAVVRAMLAGASETSEPASLPAAGPAGDDTGEPVATGA